MSRWQEQFVAHPIHETLKELRGLASTEFVDIEEQEIAERRRFNKIVVAYERSLSDLDAEVVPYNQLDSLNNALRHQNIWGQVNTYAGNGNVAHIVAANDHISNQLTQLSLLLVFSEKSPQSAEINDLEKTIDYVADALSSKKDTLAEQMDELATSVATSEQSLAKLEQLIETRRTETDAQVSAWQQQFSEAQERRNIDFSAWREKVDEKTDSSVQAIIDKTNEVLTEHQAAFVSQIDATLEDSDEKHKSILELYELVAGDSVGAGYLKNAGEEQSQANKWRWISIAFILCTTGWLFYAYNHQPGIGDTGNIIWSKLLTIVSLTGVLLFGAAYSSQQSNRHRANEKRTRWFALQVKAIDPFINSLEQEDRNKLKVLLSEKLFGNLDEAAESGGALIDEHALKVVVKSITDILGKVSKIN